MIFKPRGSPWILLFVTEKWEEIKEVAVMKTDKNTIIALMSFLLLAKNSSVKAVRSRNISQYPVCINDEVKANKTKYFKLRLSYQVSSKV